MRSGVASPKPGSYHSQGYTGPWGHSTIKGAFLKEPIEVGIDVSIGIGVWVGLS